MHIGLAVLALLGFAQAPKVENSISIGRLNSGKKPVLRGILLRLRDGLWSSSLNCNEIGRNRIEAIPDIPFHTRSPNIFVGIQGKSIECVDVTSCPALRSNM